MGKKQRFLRRKGGPLCLPGERWDAEKEGIEVTEGAFLRKKGVTLVT